MGYRIEYGPDRPRKRSGFWPLVRLPLLTAVFFLIFALGIKKVWPEGSARLRQLLLPGSGTSATREAAETFVSNLRDGDTLGDAFTAFCREIVANAQIPND